ncbi:homoserine dehydrogenase [Actinomycetospora sp. TBRC 11914]|uniref:homoserine dehydrogenase n=1 Tax=Actinomycetospora sp. TBRC 11914 TaxID=2729387 RepID=UPI00145F0A65|nr:homoserine dehydrogenase [Actinomycetospora sp. TBRC 11914]NMO91299.1 homoserine dehydrogenase [Actinomycetospora sp. TBRC 11914]
MSVDQTAKDRITVALLGCGVVGSQVVRLLREQADELTARVGVPIEIGGIAVRRPQRHPDVPAELLTTDAAGLVARPDVDVVVELMGGIEPARDLLLDALKAGRSVVSANKALLAEEGEALATAARDSGADLYYEASVAGAIPLLRPIQQSLAGDRIRRVAGIVNGTTNFILSAMESTGAGYADALEEAGRLGYAEADPTADVDGYDAASKAAILASLAFHTRVTAADVHREGIREVTATDIASARALGCTVKLLAICEQVAGDSREAEGHGDSVSARVYPAMIPKSHPLASVSGAFNAVFVEADAAGPLMFYGQGAGGPQTASAVLGDLVAAARNRVIGGRGPRDTAYAHLPIQPIGEVRTRYHVNVDVHDRAGVLAAVASVFAEHGVSIATVKQEGGREADDSATTGDDADHGGGQGTDATLVVVTHEAPDAALRATVDALSGLESVRGVASVLRVEGLGRPVHALGGAQ